MAKFEVICQARATIREVWHVEASSADEARDIVENNDGAQFISDEVEGDEEEREIRTILELPAYDIPGAIRRPGIEFWVAEVLDTDGDLHWSQIIWGDGFSAEDALKDAQDYGHDIMEGHALSVSGPYRTNCVAVAKATGAATICPHCGRDNAGHEHEPCSDDCPQYWEAKGRAHPDHGNQT